MVIDCADLDQEYRTLTGRGVPFAGPPTKQPGGIFAILNDPDGNRISLRQTGERESELGHSATNGLTPSEG